MKKYLFATAISTIMATAAMAETLTIGVGQEGRGYETFGKQIV